MSDKDREIAYKITAKDETGEAFKSFDKKLSKLGKDVGGGDSLKETGIKQLFEGEWLEKSVKGLERGTDAMLRYRDEVAKGAGDYRDFIKGGLETIPVLGKTASGAFQAGLNIRELFTGERQSLEVAKQRNEFDAQSAESQSKRAEMMATINRQNERELKISESSVAVQELWQEPAKQKYAATKAQHDLALFTIKDEARAQKEAIHQGNQAERDRIAADMRQQDRILFDQENRIASHTTSRASDDAAAAAATYLDSDRISLAGLAGGERAANAKIDQAAKDKATLTEKQFALKYPEIAAENQRQLQSTRLTFASQALGAAQQSGSVGASPELQKRLREAGIDLQQSAYENAVDNLINQGTGDEASNTAAGKLKDLYRQSAELQKKLGPQYGAGVPSEFAAAQEYTSSFTGVAAKAREDSTTESLKGIQEYSKELTEIASQQLDLTRQLISSLTTPAAPIDLP